jgi:uncharacterized membrane protein
VAADGPRGETRRDGRARALAKALTWRAIGTIDTFGWSWLVTGHAGSAGAIASLEMITKVILYYVHERLWRALSWAPNARLRSLIKAVSWRVFGSLDTFALSMIVTRNASFAASIASIEGVTKIALYYLHERAWRMVAWGRLDPAPDDDAAPRPAPAPLQ